MLSTALQLYTDIPPSPRWQAGSYKKHLLNFAQGSRAIASGLICTITINLACRYHQWAQNSTSALAELLPSVDLPCGSSSNLITWHHMCPSLETELGSSDLIECQACTEGCHHDPGPSLYLSSPSHSEDSYLDQTPNYPFLACKVKKCKLSDVAKEQLWKHQIFCHSKNQSTVPGATEKAVLQLSGLGKQVIRLSAKWILTQHLYHFQQLRSAVELSCWDQVEFNQN